MTTYILIIMLYITNGPLVTKIEFSSAERCDGALTELNSQAQSWHLSTHEMHAFCVPK